MKNVEMRVDGNLLTITVDLSQEHGLSSTGKSVIIATSLGNASVPGQDEARGVKVGLNVFRKA